MQRLSRDECFGLALAYVDEVISAFPETSIDIKEASFRQSPALRVIYRFKDKTFSVMFFDHLLKKYQLIYLLKVCKVLACHSMQ